MDLSAANELHRGERAKEEHRRYSEGVQRKPTHREDRIVAWSCGDRRSLCHELFQADVEFRLALIALANHGSLTFRSLKIGIGTRCSESVVGQAGRYKQEPRQKDGGECHGVDHPIADARDDFEERAFSC